MGLFNRKPKVDPVAIAAAENELRQRLSNSPLLDGLVEEIKGRPWITSRQSGNDEELRDVEVNENGIKISWNKYEHGPVKVVSTNKFGINKYGFDTTKVVFEEVTFDYVKSGYSSLSSFDFNSVTVPLEQVVTIWAELIRERITNAFPNVTCSELHPYKSYAGYADFYIHPASPTKSLF